MIFIRHVPARGVSYLHPVRFTRDGICMVKPVPSFVRSVCFFSQTACDKLARAQVVPPHARAISLLKGLHVEGGRPQLFSETIRAKLGIVECAALSGKL